MTPTDKLLAESFELRYGEALRRGLIGQAMIGDLVRGLAWAAVFDMPEPSLAAMAKLEASGGRLIAQLATGGSSPIAWPARRRSVRNT